MNGKDARAKGNAQSITLGYCARCGRLGLWAEADRRECAECVRRVEQILRGRQGLFARRARERGAA